MYFDALPAEIITHVFLSLPTTAAASSLAATCHYFHNVYHKQRLEILTHAVDAEFGPLDDIIQLVTHNDSQPAHVQRHVPVSEALLQQVRRVGRVAQRWEQLYPFKKWKTDYSNRRLLTSAESRLLRRAVYRLWLFTKAFHTRHHPRTGRNRPEVVAERALLLHNWTTTELAEMLDVHAILRDMVANNICPSNGKIRQKFQKRYPDSNQQLLFNIHLNYPPPPSSNFFATPGWIESGSGNVASRLQSSRFHEPGAEGWGDDISHYYIVEDMMKLDPEQILFLRDQCPLKAQVEAYVRTMFEGGEWFVNNGETFSETLGHVVRQRGGDFQALKIAVEDGEMGIAVTDD
ncbi:hypothetical protein M433DRAFT_61134 [Acidomyces richmondensis BFW]|nr:MAG: hypothetical protein FE78DRAFT_137168 [Acidomyces sp. 'richmondensis']KYG48411.1 hypothetical protein M433DRAFT_61134 [Acidomyces richmondensis BFW]